MCRPRFLFALLQEHEVQPRAFLLAQQITEKLQGSAAVIHLLELHEQTARWSAKAVAGDQKNREAGKIAPASLGGELHDHLHSAIAVFLCRMQHAEAVAAV
jgi:hypothetical protein